MDEENAGGNSLPPGGNATAAISHRIVDLDETIQTTAQSEEERPRTGRAAFNEAWNAGDADPARYGAARQAAGGGVSWGAGVRQIDRTGQNLVCDSDTVVSGLTMPTWSAPPRPWELEVGVDAKRNGQYEDPTDPCYTIDDKSNRSRNTRSTSASSRSSQETFWNKRRSRFVIIPVAVFVLLAVGAVVGVMLAGQSDSERETNPSGYSSQVIVDDFVFFPTPSIRRPMRPCPTAWRGFIPLVPGCWELLGMGLCSASTDAVPLLPSGL